MSEERMSQLRELIDAETEGPVLSVFCRTDPRDPANTGETLGWQIALKNYDKKLDVSRRHTAQVRRWARNRPMNV